MSEERKTTKIKEPLSTISDRILATIIDFFIVDLIVLICLALPFAFHLSFVLSGKSALEVLLYIFWPLMSVVAVLASSAYFIYWPIRTNGLTIGKKALGIRLMLIADTQSGELYFLTNDDLLLSFKRFIFSFVDIQLFGGLGVIFMNKSSIVQSFADEKLNTVVVESEDLKRETLDQMIANQSLKNNKEKIDDKKESEEEKEEVKEEKKPSKKEPKKKVKKKSQDEEKKEE
ncbi:MAG: RDD family protein [Candidatus Heimdallarchaeota archaeon]